MWTYNGKHTWKYRAHCINNIVLHITDLGLFMVLYMEGYPSVLVHATVLGPFSDGYILSPELNTRNGEAICQPAHASHLLKDWDLPPLHGSSRNVQSLTPSRRYKFFYKYYIHREQLQASEEKTESSCWVASICVTNTMGDRLETISAVDPEPSSVQGR
jgi:hypothetical protein